MALYQVLQALSSEDSRRPERRPGPELQGSGDHFQPFRRRAALPSRPDAADHLRRGMVDDRGRRRPAGPGPRGTSSPTSTAAGEILADGSSPGASSRPPTHFHRAAAGIDPPNGVRVHVAGIDLDPRRDGKFRVLEDNLRTAARGLLRNREPPHHDPGVPRAVRQPADKAGRRTTRSACSRRCVPPPRHGVRRPDVVAAHPRRLQRRLLRALVPRPADGRRAGRGPRPRSAVDDVVYMRTTERARSASTSSTAASTTTSSIRCTSGPTRSSAAPGS